MRRDTLEKETRSCDGIEEYVKNLLEEIQANIYQKALKYRNEHITKVDSYDQFKEQIEKRRIHPCALGRYNRNRGANQRRNKGDYPLHSV